MGILNKRKLLSLWHCLHHVITLKCPDLFIKREESIHFRELLHYSLIFSSCYVREKNQLLHSNLPAMKQSLHSPSFLWLKTSPNCQDTPQSTSAWPCCWEVRPTSACESDPDLQVFLDSPTYGQMENC